MASFAKSHYLDGPVFCKGAGLLKRGRSFAKRGRSVATIFVLMVWMIPIGGPLAWRTVQRFFFFNYPDHPDGPVSCKKNAQHDHFCDNGLYSQAFRMEDSATISFVNDPDHPDASVNCVWYDNCRADILDHLDWLA